jgi:serine/threonine protein kinase
MLVYRAGSQRGTIKDIELKNSDFVSSGGEGKIYKKGRFGYKIYTDPKKIIPQNKVEELLKIKNPNIITPIGLVCDSRGKPIGYEMNYVANTYPLCSFFTLAFKKRNNITQEMTLDLIMKIQKTIEFIHSQGVLIVDLNEMNFLIDKKFKEVYFIDVDSYQTKSYPATAIMDSIKDRHSSTFNEMTDWFSFGILSFQMFIGIHPYKGKHPTLKTFDERMRYNIPVFHKDVSYPKVCLPFDVIPDAYREWYKAIFYRGERIAPPTTATAISIIPIISSIKSNNSFEIFELSDYQEDIIDYLSINGNRVTVTSDGSIFIDKKLKIQTNCNQIAITPKYNRVICGGIDVSEGLDNGKLRIWDISNDEEIICDIRADEIMSYDGRIYIKHLDKISEIIFIELPNKTIASASIVSSIQENSSKVFDGVIIQNVLGSCVVNIFPISKKSYQIILPEMKEYQIIDAKYENQILIIIGNKSGKYSKFIFKLKHDFSSYELRKNDDIFYAGINFIVLDNNIGIEITEDEKIEIFSNQLGKNNIKVIEDKNISGDMTLFKDGNNVLFAKDKKIYKITMKK